MFNIQNAFTLLSHLFFIMITFWALQSVRIESWIKKGHETQARLMYILLSIAIGSICSQFFLMMMQLSFGLVS